MGEEDRAREPCDQNQRGLGQQPWANGSGLKPKQPGHQYLKPGQRCHNSDARVQSQDGVMAWVPKSQDRGIMTWMPGSEFRLGVVQPRHQGLQEYPGLGAGCVWIMSP
ncbi:hypothetical protein KIL84_003971 [Mauremys mutica]|uniref:Uncharacterized protein n=1 Tax=Mauremys mutica TaxID=74926 RepID=A0A9D3WW91_9SAUR|nr:hypothetical protein KIL84_003971 [Mauremys mutica]